MLRQMIILAAVAMAKKPRPMVAFYGSELLFATTELRHQVYVWRSGWQASRRQLTHERQDCDCARWVGAHHVAFLVGDHLLKVFDLRTGTIKTLLREPGRYQTIESEPVRLPPRAEHLYEIWKWKEKTPTSRTNSLAHGSKKRPIMAPSLVPRSTPNWGRSSEKTKTPWFCAPWEERNSEVGTGFAVPEGFVTAWVYRHEALLCRFYVAFVLRRVVQHRDVAELESEVELAEGHELDADVSHRWIAWVDHRDLPQQENEPNFWVASAGVKDWRTGRKVAVVSGLAWATSIGLSPYAPCRPLSTASPISRPSPEMAPSGMAWIYSRPYRHSSLRPSNRFPSRWR